MKRSLTLDFLRGFAIYMMIILHVIQHSWGGIDSLQDLDFVLSLPLYYLVPVMFLAYLSSWAGLFLLISMSVNVIAVERRLNRGVALETMRNKQVWTGVLILIIAYFTEAVTAYSGFLGSSFRNKAWNPQKLSNGLFNWETLNAIGASIIITSLVVYYLYRNGGQEKTSRNVRVLSILAAICLLLTPVIGWLINRFVYPWWLSDIDNQFRWPAGFLDVITRMILIPFNGNIEPLFPFLTTAFIGTIFGIYLSQEKPPHHLPVWGIILGLFFIISAVFLVLVGVDLTPSLGHRPDIPWYLIGLGGQIISLSVLLWIVEFKGYVNKFKQYTIFWRRWGMLALTIYCWQIIDIPLRYLVYFLTNWPAHLSNQLTVEQTLVMIVLTLAWWDLLLRLWSRIDFKYSYEWTVVWLMTQSLGIRSARMKVEEVIHKVTPMKFSTSTNQERNSFLGMRFVLLLFTATIVLLAPVLLALGF